ncbi:tyrosine-type recombinase/integrase [Amycolatopsis sp. GM8]|uniref:tyrosine-type recombinase/integrase n=1 Tax=Amycolatopsis sp. GM8 TaxID=2896530 RepID=UPI001F02B6AB|nr:tyrosine-type recombinase/integrase [Amycolatopsis sp. GM8]
MVDAPPEPPGSARLVLQQGVRLLHPEDVVYSAMLDGWGMQLRGGRRLRDRTVKAYRRDVERFFVFSAEYPWCWTASHFDEWMTTLISERGLARSTLRAYQLAVQSFCDYITSPHYHWAKECEARFGTHPVQVCHEWNTVAHLVDYEGDPARRPMTRKEIPLLFDYADDQVENAVRLRRKGALAAYRDATVFKAIYGWGLRCQETSKLDLVDFYRSPEAPELGRFGKLHVRWGKASRGSPPKRRTVASLMPWAVEAVEDYVVNVRPRLGFPEVAALWVTERGNRLRPREIESRFAEYRDELGLPSDLTPHCLRHSYITHLIEDGVDAKFVQEQAGHRFASTTAIYTAVDGDFMNKMMRKALDKALTTEEELAT